MHWNAIMADLNEDPLDLIGDDGDGVNEMCLLFDEDGKNKQTGPKPPIKSGCCVFLLAIGVSVIGAGVFVTTLFC